MISLFIISSAISKKQSLSLNLISKSVSIALKFIFNQAISHSFLNSLFLSFVSLISSQIFIQRINQSSPLFNREHQQIIFKLSKKLYFIVDDFYRMFVKKTNKIRLFRNQIDRFFKFAIDSNNSSIFKIAKSRDSFTFIAFIIQTRITLYFKFIDLFVAKSSNNAICETIYDSKKSSTRVLYVQN